MINKSSCNSCGGRVRFDPKTQKLICEYCHNSQEVKTSNDHNNHPTDKLDLYTCPSCGAKLVSEDNDITTFCVYCKNENVVRAKLVDAFHPEGIIPFKMTKEDAITNFENIKDTSLVAFDFLDKKNIEEIRGVYIPFWLLDINVTGTMRANTKTTKMYDEPGQDVYVEKIKEYVSERHGDISYKQVPVDGSTHFADDIMQNIEPFDYDEIKPYSSDYLSGFLAEIYDLSGEEVLKDAEARIEKSAYEIFRKSLTGGSPIEIDNIDFKYTSKIEKEKYVLLPVYLLNIKHNGKIHTFAMNGQTGKITGNLPMSKLKAVIHMIISIFISFSIVTFICGLAFLNNNLTNIEIFFWLLLYDLAFIVSLFFLWLEKSKLNLIEKNPKINNYLDDRIIEVRKNKLINQKDINHDYSRASKISIATGLGVAALSNIRKKK